MIDVTTAELAEDEVKVTLETERLFTSNEVIGWNAASDLYTKILCEYSQSKEVS